MKKCVCAEILSQNKITSNIFEMWIRTELAEEVKPGQFVGVYTRNKSLLLPRPISVCEVSGDRTAVRIVYRRGEKGTGTYEMSQYAPGSTCSNIKILGPLGNGFPLEKGEGKKVFLIGGGIGIPPLVELSKQLNAEKQIIVGYRDRAQFFLKSDLEQYGQVYIATEDGSNGTKGNVMDAIRENGLEADVIYACGPMPMLRAIKAYAAEKGMPAYISLEEHMACGVGACLGCVVKTKEIHHHTYVNNARICTDGPVFEAAEVDI